MTQMPTSRLDINDSKLIVEFGFLFKLLKLFE